MKFRIIKVNEHFYPQMLECRSRGYNTDVFEFIWVSFWDAKGVTETSFKSYDETKSFLDKWIEEHKINIVYEREENVDRWHHKK